MSKFRRLELIEHSPFPWETTTTTTKLIASDPFFPSLSSVHEDFDFTLDLLNPILPPFDAFDAITDLLLVEKTTTRPVQRRVDPVGLRSELYIRNLCDRVSALELSLEKEKEREKEKKIVDRKYTWTAEIKDPEEDGLDRKYKWTAEIEGGKKKNYKYTAEIKGKGKDSSSRKYTFTASSGDAGDHTGSSPHKEEKLKEKLKEKPKEKKDKVHKDEKKSGTCTRLVEIQDPAPDHGALVLRQAFAKRVEKQRGKRKELSPQDAAAMIQMTFKAYLIRRSQALRALRELAIAKNKLKEIRALFNNFTYRRRIERDAEERQKFSEKIIVLLLTVDSIEGADILVRSAKKSMVDELEAMLDVVDPHPGGRSQSLKRRTFDMPDSVIRKELAAEVAQVVQMLDDDASGSEIH